MSAFLLPKPLLSIFDHEFCLALACKVVTSDLVTGNPVWIWTTALDTPERNWLLSPCMTVTSQRIAARCQQPTITQEVGVYHLYKDALTFSLLILLIISLISLRLAFGPPAFDTSSRSSQDFNSINCLNHSGCLVVLIHITIVTVYSGQTMDHHPDSEWRSGVEGAIVKLESGMNEITRMLKDLSQPPSPHDSGAAANPAPATRQIQPILEPRLTPPELFKGEPDQCRPFLTQCDIHFQLQPSSFPSERSKVAYAISLLAGKAKTWGTNEWQRNSSSVFSFAGFSKELCRVFDPVLPEREAARRLFSVKQGSRRVTEYIIEFHAIANGSHWNEEALTDAFYRGLSNEIKDGLATKRYPDSLQDLEDIATRVDLRLLERARELNQRPYRRPRPLGESVTRYELTTSRPPSPPVPQGEPMQIGRSRLTPEERERRRHQHLCFYCGQASHVISNCPLKGQAQ